MLNCSLVFQHLCTQSSIAPSWRFMSRVWNSEPHLVNTWASCRCTSPSSAPNGKSWPTNSSTYRSTPSLMETTARIYNEHMLMFQCSCDRRRAWPSWMKRRHWWMSSRGGRLSRASYWRPSRLRRTPPCRKSPHRCRCVFEVCVKSPECICDPCWQNECECACSNFELQAKEVKNVSFGQIWGFHKNEFIALF